jgi:hypothetical protein
MSLRGPAAPAVADTPKGEVKITMLSLYPIVTYRYYSISSLEDEGKPSSVLRASLAPLARGGEREDPHLS